MLIRCTLLLVLHCITEACTAMLLQPWPICSIEYGGGESQSHAQKRLE